MVAALVDEKPTSVPIPKWESPSRCLSSVVHLDL
jgi:hypothetical protein